jgi:hypothetical protein
VSAEPDLRAFLSPGKQIYNDSGDSLTGGSRNRQGWESNLEEFRATKEWTK